jgi:hypothetical protein
MSFTLELIGLVISNNGLALFGLGLLFGFSISYFISVNEDKRINKRLRWWNVKKLKWHSQY